MVLISCSTNSSCNHYNTTYATTTLNLKTKTLLDIYLNEHNELLQQKEAIEIAVHHYNMDHYVLLLDHSPLEQIGYHPNANKHWKVTYFHSFKVYINDSLQTISTAQKDSVTICYQKHRDSILPYGEFYPWELHFRNKDLDTIRFIEDHTVQKVRTLFLKHPSK
ncbi:hypothetical protein [Pustulibacterium marinum]|uniref:hypothetical protein n=1 Tax=Pustulibacterium marinum TaxID=1224947 RepID=UPI000B818EA9|nr:hypothetical protein [Pustulibacterium marinum]